MSDQAEKQDFITTIKELMRLTREGVLDWSVEHPSSIGTRLSTISTTRPDPLPTYRAEYENLVFIIKDKRQESPNTDLTGKSTSVTDVINDESNYILKIDDREDDTTLSSPPMKPIRDLISVIKKNPKKDKLRDINEKLSDIG